MSRKKIVAGNWKMNQDIAGANALVNDILSQEFTLDANTEIVIAPPYIMIPTVATCLNDQNQLFVAAQNCHQEEAGAYTGEISAKMIKSAGCKYVILGHSERRMYQDESDHLLATKVDTALKNNLHVIFCCGEALDIREADTQDNYVNIQLEKGLFHLTAEQFANIVIAYEPIWAIGTGKTASPEQAQAMHANIRSHIANHYGTAIANATSILYGGSCNASNAADLFSQEDIDGGLIGGASLKAADFVTIINAI